MLVRIVTVTVCSAILVKKSKAIVLQILHKFVFVRREGEEGYHKMRRLRRRIKENKENKERKT
eukprot:767734-Hanusia_phi.AAC.9